MPRGGWRAVALALVAACGSPPAAPRSPAPAPAPRPAARPPRTTPVRFDWPAHAVFRVDLVEDLDDTAGITQNKRHTFLIAYHREAPDRHRFWEAGLSTPTPTTSPMLLAMLEVEAAPSFAIGASLVGGEPEGEEEWTRLMKESVALAEPTPESERALAALENPEFIDYARNERWSEWAYVVAAWWPFYLDDAGIATLAGADGERTPGGFVQRVPDESSWPATWTHREEGGVAILTMVAEGELDVAPSRNHFRAVIATQHQWMFVRGRGTLTLELRTDPDTMVPQQLIETRDVVLRDLAGVEHRGRLQQRATYQLAPVGTPVWRPLR